ncbi:MAG: class I SAM-dependent methyltransferase [Verrucomicrobia bacterium]|nr:class I SAM-dependent methyltransferase [Verrucomicrobiota bacterium]
MRTTIYKLIQELGRSISFKEPIHEFGACPVTGQEDRGRFRDCFPGKVYVGSDLVPGPGVDEIQDLHHLTLKEESLGTALVLENIHHVREPWRAVQEVYRCLQPGGILIMTSVMFFPSHPWPDDYWRFTTSGMAVLLQPFEQTVLTSCGLRTLPHTVIGIGFKSPVNAELVKNIESVVGQWKESGSRSWKETLLDLLPPVVIVPAWGMYTRWLSRQGSHPPPPRHGQKAG